MNNKIESPVADLSWCWKCLTGFKNTTICPQCKADSGDKPDPKVRQFMSRMFRTQLDSVIPDLADLVQKMRSGSLKELLESIARESVEESGLYTTKIGPFDFRFWCDMQELYQPSEPVRAIIFAVSNELSGEERAEFLSRPQILALNLQQALSIDQQFSQDRYAPLPPLKLVAEEEAMKKVFHYLATREALSCENWQQHFSKALANGMLSASEVEKAKESWRQMAQMNQHVEKPLTPWLLTLEKLGYRTERRDSLAVLAGFANHSVQVKDYWAAEEIAQATLKLVHEVSEAEGYVRDNQNRDSLLFNLKGILANCAAMSDDDDDLAVDRARYELITSSMESFSDTIDETIASMPESLQDSSGESNQYSSPGAIHDRLETSIAPMLDVLVQLQFADQCFNNGAFEKAEVKYNRIIFTLKGAFEDNATDEADKTQNRAERIMMVLPELIALSSTCVPLVRATIRLAEVKIKKSELQAAEELLESALHYANATVQRSTSKVADLKNHSEDLEIAHTISTTNQISACISQAIDCLKAIIYGNLVLVHDAGGKRQKAELYAKKATKLLNELKPSDLNGFALSHAEIKQLCEKLKK